MEEAALTPNAVDVGGTGWREVVAEAEETLAFLEGAFWRSSRTTCSSSATRRRRRSDSTTSGSFLGSN